MTDKIVMTDFWGQEHEFDPKEIKADGAWKARRILQQVGEASTDYNVLVGMVWWVFDDLDDKLRKIAMIRLKEEREKAFMQVLRDLTQVESITRERRKKKA